MLYLLPYIWQFVYLGVVICPDNRMHNSKTIDKNNCDFVFRKTETSDSKVMMGELIENNIMTRLHKVTKTHWRDHQNFCFYFEVK
jgi:hypothetical protein